MRLAEIEHYASEPYCYPLNEEELIINIKTGFDVRRVFLIYGDPYDAGILGGNWKWNGTEEEIFFQKRMKKQIFWTTTVKPEYKRCRYYFRLEGDGEAAVLYEDGAVRLEKKAQEHEQGQCFVFPWMNAIDIARTPEWVNETIWYQIFPDRFQVGSPQHLVKDRRYTAWRKGSVTNQEFYGGNLNGIREKLTYLKDLGITGIYLTPVFASPSTHKYDTTDYFRLDPGFGTDEEFRALIMEAHALGIRIMIDGVFNHCGRTFPRWKDVQEKGSESEYFDWFLIHRLPLDPLQKDTRDHAYDSFAFSAGMPKLNTGNAAVREYFLSVCRYWKTNFGIDGIRLDVANELSHRFCKELRLAMKELDPDFFILGEVWHNALPWLRGDEFDSVMNYPLTGSIHEFFRNQKRTKLDFEELINHCYTMYMQQTNDVLFNLLDSHDTIRLRNKTADLNEFYQQLAILFTMPGSPCIYYGTEVALAGEHDPDCRRCMPWQEIEEGKYRSRIELIRELTGLRKELPAMRSRHFHFPNTYSQPRMVEYLKIDEDGNFVEILLNCSGEEISVRTEKNDHKVFLKKEFHHGVLKPGGILIRSTDGNTGTGSRENESE